jgi:hypothetical protein
MKEFDHVTTLIYEAVSAAINAGMQPEDFKREVIASWRQVLKEDADRAERILSAR